MNRQPIMLGFILRNFPEFDFKMNEFNDRMRLQKFIYLLQAHGIYLGYDFSWYLRGPYCTTLAAAGFALDGFYDAIPEKPKNTRFANNTIQARYRDFAKFIHGKENDANFLEAAASLHFLLKTSQMTDDAVVKKVVRKMPRGTEESYVRSVMKQMRQGGLL